MTEQSRIQTLIRLFGADADSGVPVGIGDDAAVLDLPEGARLVVSVDEQVEGTHFRRELLAMEDIGYRSVMAAASDLAAMGASPLAIVAALALPGDMSDQDFEALARGQRQAAEGLDCPVVGGNLARGPVLSVATTVLGTIDASARPLTRSGARVGDAVYVAGSLGLAALGFDALVAGHLGAETALARAAWQRPRARIADGLRALRAATSAIDVSDGLAKDLGALCLASGVGAELDAESLTRLAHASGADLAARALGADVLARSIRGGEDYALVVASSAPIEGFVRIGTFVLPQPDAEAGARVFLRFDDGRREPISGGFDHFDAQEKSV